MPLADRLADTLVLYLKGDGPAPDARVSVGLRLDKDWMFLPLVRNGSLSAVASPAQISEMGACS